MNCAKITWCTFGEEPRNYQKCFCFSSWLNPKYCKHMEQFSRKYIIIKQICLCHLQHYFLWQGKWNLMFRFYFIWSSAVLAEDYKKKRQMALLEYELICAYSNINLDILDKGMAQTSNWIFEAKSPSTFILVRSWTTYVTVKTSLISCRCSQANVCTLLHSL